MDHARAATDLGKRMVLVEETDASHGAVSFGTHVADCPTDLRAKLQALPRVEWHRTRHLQDVSLHLILGHLLGGSVYLTGELSQQPLELPVEGVTLYVSPHNPGAASLVYLINDMVHRAEKSSRKRSAAFRKSSEHMGHRDQRSTSERLGDLGDVSDRSLASVPSLPLRSQPFVRLAASPGIPHYFLLHLSESTFESWRNERVELIEELEDALRRGVQFLLVHEQRSGEGGAVPFDTIIQRTPQQLLTAGIYNTLAQPIYGGKHQEVCLRLLVKALGKEKQRHPRRSAAPGETCLTLVDAVCGVTKHTIRRRAHPSPDLDIELSLTVRLSNQTLVTQDLPS